MKKTFLVVLLCACFTSLTQAQTVAVKTNLLYGAAAKAPNLGVEFGLGNHTTFDFWGAYNPWNLNGTDENNKKLVHWIVQPAFRYWLCEKFNGHFFGVHALYSQYNISEHNIPLLLGEDSGKYRFEGDAFGGGISYGYSWVIGKHWNLEFEVGAGFAVMKYDKYDCAKCSDKRGTFQRTYLGPTKAGISLVYSF